jgi:hypothetical protein
VHHRPSMKFPESWGTQKRKTDAVESVKPKKQKVVESGNETSADIYNEIYGCITLVQPVSSEDELNIDGLLSKIPYKKILEELFHEVAGKGENIPIVTKAYEESFLREPVKNERACIMNSQCEGNFIDPKTPFVLTEFLLPQQDTGQDCHMCVLCSRKATKQLYFDMMYEGHTYNGVIQRYGNICDQKGEYAKEVMLFTPPKGPVHCMPFPIVNHKRSNLEVHISQGVKHIVQKKVAFEDFQ